MKAMLKVLGWGVIVAFAALYGVALALYVADALGLSGGSVSNAFLAPLGSPWNRIVAIPSEGTAPLWAAVAPLVNLGLLYLLCRPRRRAGKA
jgi:hypothetical protein